MIHLIIPFTMSSESKTAVPAKRPSYTFKIFCTHCERDLTNDDTKQLSDQQRWICHKCMVDKPALCMNKKFKCGRCHRIIDRINATYYDSGKRWDCKDGCPEDHGRH